MIPNVNKYPYDKTGMSPTNKVVDEIHVLEIDGFTALIPKHTPYFTESLVVKNSNGDTLGHENYINTLFHQKLTNKTHKSISGAIIIRNAKKNEKYKITYQAVGGDNYLTAEDIKYFLQEIDASKSRVKWEDILNKPTSFWPYEHIHHVSDIRGFGPLATIGEKILQAIKGDSAELSAEVIKELENIRQLINTKINPSLTLNRNKNTSPSDFLLNKHIFYRHDLILSDDPNNIGIYEIYNSNIEEIPIEESYGMYNVNIVDNPYMRHKNWPLALLDYDQEIKEFTLINTASGKGLIQTIITSKINVYGRSYDGETRQWRAWQRVNSLTENERSDNTSTAPSSYIFNQFALWVEDKIEYIINRLYIKPNDILISDNPDNIVVPGEYVVDCGYDINGNKVVEPHMWWPLNVITKTNMTLHVTKSKSKLLRKQYIEQRLSLESGRSYTRVGVSNGGDSYRYSLWILSRSYSYNCSNLKELGDKSWINQYLPPHYLPTDYNDFVRNNNATIEYVRKYAIDSGWIQYSYNPVWIKPNEHEGVYSYGVYRTAQNITGDPFFTNQNYPIDEAINPRRDTYPGSLSIEPISIAGDQNANRYIYSETVYGGNGCIWCRDVGTYNDSGWKMLVSPALNYHSTSTNTKPSSALLKNEVDRLDRRINNIPDGIKIGMMIPVPGNFYNEEYLDADGRNYDINLYPELFALLGTDVLPNMVQGVGTTVYSHSNTAPPPGYQLWAGAIDIHNWPNIYNNILNKEMYNGRWHIPFPWYGDNDCSGFFLRVKPWPLKDTPNIWRDDAIRNIYGTAGPIAETFEWGGGVCTGAFEKRSKWGNNTPKKTDGSPSGEIVLDASRVVPVAAENRPKSMYMNTYVQTHVWSGVPYGYKWVVKVKNKTNTYSGRYIEADNDQDSVINELDKQIKYYTYKQEISENGLTEDEKNTLLQLKRQFVNAMEGN